MRNVVRTMETNQTKSTTRNAKRLIEEDGRNNDDANSATMWNFGAGSVFGVLRCSDEDVLVELLFLSPWSPWLSVDVDVVVICRWLWWWVSWTGWGAHADSAPTFFEMQLWSFVLHSLPKGALPLKLLNPLLSFWFWVLFFFSFCVSLSLSLSLLLVVVVYDHDRRKPCYAVVSARCIMHF